MPAGTPRIPQDGIRSAPPLRTRLLRSCKTEIARLPHHTSYKSLQTRPHFLRGPEQAILGGFFRRSENVPNGTQPQPFIMPELENRPLPGRQSFQRERDALAQLPIPQLPLGIGGRPLLRDPRNLVNRPVRSLHHSGFFL